MPIQVAVSFAFPVFCFCTHSASLDNPLQTAVLNLFVTLKYRFPNLVVGSITRESVKKALENGISAEQVRISWVFLVVSFIPTSFEQIISYLTTHAHPQMHKNVCLSHVGNGFRKTDIRSRYSETAFARDRARPNTTMGA